MLRRLGVKSSPLFALHTCDNPWCINPGHIIPGTHQENMDQMVSRGRTKGIRVGERNGRALLKESDVVEIRKNRGVLTADKVAAKYGLSTTYIGNIWRRRTWKHLL